MGQSELPQEGAIQPKQLGFFRRSAAWLFSQQHFHFKLLSGTAAGVSVIVLLAGIFLYVTVRNHQQETLRAHTIEVIRQSSLIENDIAGLETGHRGFLLTGKEEYVTSFNRRSDMIKRRIEDLTGLILDNPKQRKRVMKVQEVVQKWLDTVALPELRSHDRETAEATGQPKSVVLGNSLLDQGRAILEALQDEEQIVLNQRMLEQEWAAQSTQMLDFLPKLERSVLEMQKEKRGYLLTGDTHFVEAYQRAITDFYTYNGYLSILVANSPGQAELLAEVRSNIERWIKTCAVPEIDAKRDSKDTTALGLNDTGETLMTDIRQALASLEKTELNVYENRTAIARRDRLIKTSVLGCLALLAVALLVVSNSYSFTLVRRQLSKLEGVETRIRSIIENILDGMITLDEQGVICSLNPAAEKMFGYTEQEMVGYKFTKLIPKFYGSEPDAKAVPWGWGESASSSVSRSKSPSARCRSTTKSFTSP